MRPAYSLRLRLFALIIVPLTVAAILIGFWRYTVAHRTAEELFDRALLSAALAISRDVAVSGGDALLPSTSGLIGDAAGGEVFYHATGPGGIYVTGYAYPPVSGAGRNGDLYAPNYLEANYRGERVRVLQITERVTIDNLTGDATVTVWQRLADRHAFATQLAVRAASVIGALMLTLGLVVWFGVQLGLRPLIDLHDAIAVRSPEDLSKIKRPVPAEVRGIVETLNRLFGKVETSINAHQVFISDAAHQLRNPAAAVLSMAEAVRDAGDETERQRRVSELIAAARDSSRVAEQLLSLDRLQQPGTARPHRVFDLNALSEQTCALVGAEILSRGLDFEFVASDEALPVCGDAVFVSEAIKNLVDNAVRHGGSDLTMVRVVAARIGDHATVTVSDDGIGLLPDQEEQAFRRFGQLEPSSGSGLGLAIVSSVADSHGGTLRIDEVPRGASLTLSLPRAG